MVLPSEALLAEKDLPRVLAETAQCGLRVRGRPKGCPNIHRLYIKLLFSLSSFTFLGPQGVELDTVPQLATQTPS